MTAPAIAADYRIRVDFYTPDHAAICWEDHHEVQLECFRPSDGFSVYMYPTGRVPRKGDLHRYSDAPVRNPAYRRWLRDSFDMGSGGLLRFRFRWTEWQALTLDYTCLSRATGLTCKNGSGHGWWLGRSRGHRIF